MAAIPAETSCSFSRIPPNTSSISIKQKEKQRNRSMGRKHHKVPDAKQPNLYGVLDIYI
jgi:hypothetical protein